MRKPEVFHPSCLAVDKKVEQLEEENNLLRCKLIEAEHSIQHALSAINDALEEKDK